jgi:aldose 1-epimerase
VTLQHTYWSIGGFSSGETTVLRHVLAMPDADSFQEVDAGLIPTGRVLGVGGNLSFMDFRAGRAVGAAIANGSLPSGAAGYDNSFLFTGAARGDFRARAFLAAPDSSGLRMTVSTDQPAIQVYSGNFLSGDIPRKRAQGTGFYERYSALALETQQRIGAANDAAHQADIRIDPGQAYAHHTRYEFALI